MKYEKEKIENLSQYSIFYPHLPLLQINELLPSKQHLYLFDTNVDACKAVQIRNLTALHSAGSIVWGKQQKLEV